MTDNEMTGDQTATQNNSRPLSPGKLWRSSISGKDVTIRFIMAVTDDYVAYRNCSPSGNPLGNQNQLHEIPRADWDKWVRDVRAECITTDMIPFPPIEKSTV